MYMTPREGRKLLKRTEIVGVVAVLINLDSEEVEVVQGRHNGHMREPCGHAFLSMLSFMIVRACLGKMIVLRESLFAPSRSWQNLSASSWRKRH